MWHPEIEAGPAPFYERLVHAIASDVRRGALAAGARLPPQRDLAFRLGVSVGSVTRAYAEAERRGLLVAHVGRGSFVRGASSPVPDVPALERGAGGRAGIIDLRCNTPPPVPLMHELDLALSQLTKRGALDPALHYIQGPGLAPVRHAAARWIADGYGLDVAAENLIQCNGGQHGIALAFSSFCGPGDTVLCESTTFYGARMAAEHLGLRLHGVAMDEEGIRPDALDRAAAETGSRMLFTLPTLHNPTTRTMSAQRRQDIARVARAGSTDPRGRCVLRLFIAPTANCQFRPGTNALSRQPVQGNLPGSPVGVSGIAFRITEGASDSRGQGFRLLSARPWGADFHAMG